MKGTLNQGLEERCRAKVAQGLWTLYALLADPDPGVRAGAVDILGAVETDERRLRALVGPLIEQDPDEEVRRSAAEAMPSSASPLRTR